MEDELIRAVVGNPDDESARAAYAGWLHKHDAVRAEAFELLVALGKFPKDAWGMNQTLRLKQIRLKGRLSRLRGEVDAEWLALLDRAFITNCDLRFSMVCPKKWELLQPTANAFIRHCEGCQKDVHYCATADEAREHATRGDCVAIGLAELREAPSSPKQHVVGRLVCPPTPRRGSRVRIRTGVFREHEGRIERFEAGSVVVSVSHEGFDHEVFVSSEDFELL